MSSENTPETVERDRLIEEYVAALDRGDFEAAASVIESAARFGPEMDSLISALHRVIAVEEGIEVTRKDRDFARTLLRRHSPAGRRAASVERVRGWIADVSHLFAVPVWRWTGAAGLAGLVIAIGVLVAPLFRHHSRLHSLPEPPQRHFKHTFHGPISPLETRLYADETWLRGGESALRVSVTDHRTGKPTPASVRVRLISAWPHGWPGATLVDGEPDSRGVIDSSFRVPDVALGHYLLHVTVDSPLGSDDFKQWVDIRGADRLLLTADKPVYQPGQVIQFRLLALNLPTRHALSGEPVTFEVRDGRGNRVYQEKTKLSEFGIASAACPLADEVNLGDWVLSAALPENDVQQTVRVERYVLPRFQVKVSTERSWYLLGDRVRGTVRVRTFFGEPVARVRVNLDASLLGQTLRIDAPNGVTDSNGDFSFRFRTSLKITNMLPDSMPLAIHASVRDNTAEQHDGYASPPVALSPVMLSIRTDSTGLFAGVPNRVFVAASRPDGTAVAGLPLHLKYASEGRSSNLSGLTDRLGLVEFEMSVPSVKAKVWTYATLSVSDDAGHKMVGRLSQLGAPYRSLVLRPEKTILKVGDLLRVDAITTAAEGHVRLSCYLHDRLLRTSSSRIAHHSARFVLHLPAGMAGPVELRAYFEGATVPDTTAASAVPDYTVALSRVLFVPRDHLTVEARPDHDQYRPGATADFRFQVLDRLQRPAHAALSLACVDESVFAISDLDAAARRAFFGLADDLAASQVGGLGIDEVASGSVSAARLTDDERQRAAAYLLQTNDSDWYAREPAPLVDSWNDRWEHFSAPIDKEMTRSLEQIDRACRRFEARYQRPLTEKESLYRLVKIGFLDPKYLIDRWGHPYRTQDGGSPYEGYYLGLVSAGPDGKWNTWDDIAMSIGGFFQPGVITPSHITFFAGASAYPAASIMFSDGHMIGGLERQRAPAGELGGFVAHTYPEAMAGAASLAQAAPASEGQRPEVPSAPRVRSYFPETLYWNPELVTDEHGEASATVPLADSITSWRMSAVANTADGQLGSATSSIRVFQDFFVDMQLPIALTQGDRIAVPVTVSNYRPLPQTVAVTLQTGPGCTLQAPARQLVHVAANDVQVVYYPVVMQRLGKQALTVNAIGPACADAVRRTVEVTPEGREVESVVNGVLRGTAARVVSLPSDGLAGTAGIQVKLYPGAFSQVMDGLEGLLQAPYGCFEQTSSCTYPNVLALDYLQRHGKSSPEVKQRAETFIQLGYQRLLTFECQHGGFSWFGDEPANQVLTAYGLLEFHDMARVFPVDPDLVQRTQRWLALKQRRDGSWYQSSPWMDEGIVGRQTNALRSTAYIAWALRESGYDGPEVKRAVRFVLSGLGGRHDPYFLALALNLLQVTGADSQTTARTAQALINAAWRTEGAAGWASTSPTFTGAEGNGADLETTGMAAYALARWNGDPAFLAQVLNQLVRSRNGAGGWDSTQGTVWSLKALLQAQGASRQKPGTTVIEVNGQTLARIPSGGDDLAHTVNLGSATHPGANRVVLRSLGGGTPIFQVVARWYVPWSRSVVRPSGPLSIQVSYDRTTIRRDELAHVSARVANVSGRVVPMPMIELGIPPGFTVQPGSLDQAVSSGQIQKYVTGKQRLEIYLTALGAQQQLRLTFAMRSRFPMEAEAPASRAYPYYDPESVSVSAPQHITVQM